MSQQDHYRTLFNYHFATTTRLMDQAAALDDAAYHHSPGHGHGSLHGLFLHLLRTDCSWRIGLLTGKQQAGLDPNDFGDLDALRAGFAQESVAWQEYLAGLDDAQIDGALEMTNWRGDVYTMLRWRILQHVLFHGMQHHAEIAALLTTYGQSPGDIDFFFYQDT